MKRDMDLIRKILLCMEDSPDDKSISINIDSYSDLGIQYHLYLLTQAGLIESVNVTSVNERYHFLPMNITWNGHEFLSLVRKDSVWINTKELLKSVGDTAFEVIMKVLIQVATTKVMNNI